MPAAEEEVVLRGKGVHTGASNEIRIRKRRDSGGPRFFWHGWSEALLPADLISLNRRAHRSTILEKEGRVIRTPEHLLAAALFFTEAPLDIFCDDSEPPGMDGSARPFYSALAQMAPEAANPPRWKEYHSKLHWEYEGREGRLRASPSDSFSVDYEWDVLPFKQRFELTDAATAAREVLPARTFILYREWRVATVKQDSDLLTGAEAGSGLLFAESTGEFEAALRNHPEFQGRKFPLLHPENLRMEQEPVRHKILDLLGDLALMGLALPRLRLEIRNGGHALNHLLLEQLLHERREHTGS